MYVPLYILVPLAILAVAALLERVLLPSVRVVLRRRARRLVEKVNEGLRLKLRPFKLTRKRTVEEMLVHDPEVARVAADYRAERDLSWDEVTDLLRVYAREIVPRFNLRLYYRLAHWFARRVARATYRIKVAFLDRRSLAAMDRDASVVFIMNHRSNFDYILVSYLVAQYATISYAVGEWARIWPLDTLIRRTGAYFVRRRASDPLYRKVLERYVQLAAESGVTQGIFPEGRLTRDGRLQSPRVGLLHYLLKRFDPQGGRDMVFVPVGINYDRVFEDRTHVMADTGTLPKSGSPLTPAIVAARFVGKNALLWLRGRLHRFGYACVTFGTPISLKATLAGSGLDFRTLPEDRYREEVEGFARRLMTGVAAAVPATPTAVVSLALLETEESSISADQLRAAAEAQVARLKAAGAHVVMPRNSLDRLVDVGLRTLTLRHLVRRDGDALEFARAERPMLAYYANSVAHFLIDDRHR